MVTYDIDDKYSPEGHKWIRVKASFLFGDYYYCPKTGKLYRPTVEEITDKWFDKHYLSDRKEALIKKAERQAAFDKVTVKDLRKLGYI